MTDKIFAVIRVRGIRNMDPKIKMTLEHLRLNKPNHCVIIKATDQLRGMLKKVKDYIAYGGISEDVLFTLLLKRGKEGGKPLKTLKNEDEIMGMAKEILSGKGVKEFVNPVFMLHPPRKGYKNVKLHSPIGSLSQIENIDSLLKRMI